MVGKRTLRWAGLIATLILLLSWLPLPIPSPTSSTVPDACADGSCCPHGGVCSLDGIHYL